MEDYDVFVQHWVSQLRKNEEEDEEPHRPSSSSSVICFYGRPVLPPLLSGKQREEMQQHREEVQKVAHRKFRPDPRMAYVQTVLHSVQLRKTPTLEELLQESEITTESSHPHNTNRVSFCHRDVFVGSMERLSPSCVGKLKDSSFLPPKTSTTYSAFFSSDTSPQHSYHEGRLSDQLYSQQESQPCSFSGDSHQSPSSGYVTNENPENITSISGRIDSGSERHVFNSSGDVSNTGGFFLRNSSNTVAKMPDIISHPPVDGEELERSGLESVVCSNFLGVKETCDTSFHNNNATCDQFGQSEIKDPGHVVHEESVPFITKLDTANKISVNRNEGLVTLTDKKDFLDNPDSSCNPPCLTPELHAQKPLKEAEPELVDSQIDTRQSEEPHPMSLQALLKKSQEYRRRQRMIRNQAKNTKIQERTQEQPKARTEEQSLSDKENDHKGNVTAEGKKTKERRSTFITSSEKKMIESEATGEKTIIETESTNVTREENTKQLMSVKEDTTLKNKLNSPLESKVSCDLIQQWPIPAETALIQDAFHRTTSLGDFQKGLGKYRTVPVPNFCQSPVRFKSKGSPKETAEETLAGSSDSNEVKKVSLELENSPTAVPPTVTLMEDDGANVFAKSSLHIDQLESNLSSLKVLISGLESTVKENFNSHHQTESNVENEPSFKAIKHSELIHNDRHVELVQRKCLSCLEEQQGSGDDGNNVDDWVLQQRKSFINLHEDLEPEPSFTGLDDVHLTVQEGGPGIVALSQQSLCKTTTDKGDGKLAKSDAQNAACSVQQLPAECLTSVAQRMCVSNTFQDVPFEKFPSSVFSDQSNHPDLREREIIAEGRCSVRSPSLNQSYDVETPSGLWFLEGSGSDLGSQSHFGQKKYLTPESGDEDKGGVSKVKRRLLMNGTEGTQERSTGSVVRPNSSTPRVNWGDGIQRDKQEHLKQVHEAQVRALQDQHKKQQEELLQVLAARYRLLQNMSPRSMSSSRPRDTLTFSTLSQPRSPLSQRYRPLLAAAMKGFLTRRLLRTERVAQLVRTIRDMQQFLLAFQPQDTGRGEFSRRQDTLLQERVALQLRAARYEVYDVFFSLSAGEQMQLISWDRELARERQLRRQSGHKENPRRKSFLSAATQKSLERKREIMIQKKAAERHRGVVTKTGHKSRFTAEKPQETKRGQFKANPQRVPKSSCSSRP